MTFIFLAALYGVSFALALKYFGWPAASIWIVGLLAVVYNITRFADAIRSSVRDGAVKDEL